MLPNFIKNISPTEMIIIGAILVMVIGRKAVISLGKTGGETLKEIMKIKKSFTDSVEDDEPKEAKEEVEN